jgi:hypothetical protein
LVALLLAIPGAPTADDRAAELIDGLPQGQLCVGYRTVKGMLWFADAEVVGTVCGAPIVIAPVDEGRTLRVTLPTRFDSGNGKRDAHVAEILGPDMAFEAPLPDLWEAGLPPAIELAGTLLLQGRRIPLPVVFRQLPGGDYGFSVSTTFSALGVNVPNVGPGGMVARPRDDLTLLGRIPAADVEVSARPASTDRSAP